MIKNKIILFTIVILSIGSLSAQEIEYKLKGTVSQPEDGKTVYLKAFNDKKSNFIVIDSTKIEKESFFFKETLKGDPRLRFIEIADRPDTNDLVYFVAENGDIEIDLTGHNQKLSGTKSNIELQELQNNIIELSDQLKYIKEQDSLSENEFKDRMYRLVNKNKQYRFDYIQKNIDKEQGEFILLGSFQMFSPDTVILMVDKTRPSFQNSDAGKQLIEYYKPIVQRTAGSKFTDLDLKDLSGKTVKLSDYVGKGKVVLIDFWASWCAPCIREMPDLVKLYDEYKDKDFEIVGISLDDQEETWKNTVDKFNVKWPQISDLKGWKSDVVKQYAIYSIPFTLLVDKDGTIIGENIQGKDLTQKLNELLE